MLPLNQIFRLAAAKEGPGYKEMAFDIISDPSVAHVMMSRKDGFETCERLKNDECNSRIQIVMIMAKVDTGSKLEDLERGVNVCLTKPFHKEELLLCIEKLHDVLEHLQQHYFLIAGLHNGEGALEETPAVSAVENSFVQKARSIVEDHMSDLDFDVGQFCRALMMSHPQVHRKLTALTGLSAIKFIRTIRLNKAATLLLDPGLSITAIAFDSGFSDPSYFGKTFKHEFGLTPLEWRAQHLWKH